jgi:general secretion pathway protein A
VVSTAAQASVPAAKVSPRRACESQLEAVATSDDVMHVRRLPDGLGHTLKSSPRLCRFAVGQDSWVAWLGRNEALHIVAAQQATRKVQESLKGMGLLDAREPDGLFGSKTGEAFARFQQQNGLAPTGQPDELTFLLLEHQDASLR